MSGFDNYDAWKTASPYDDYQEFDEGRLVAAIAKLDDGRNGACFPVLSFGGRDADLTGGGCTGILSVRTQDGTVVDKAIVTVGGHKAICPDDDWSEQQMDLAQEIVCGSGFGVRGSGDSWILAFEDVLVIEASIDDDLDDGGDYDYDKIAARVVAQASLVCDNFSNEMEYLEKSFEEIGKSVDS